MKSLRQLFCCLIFTVSVLSCSSDGDPLVMQQDYLNAQVGESSYNLSAENGTFIAQRIAQSDGSVKLLIDISDLNGDGFSIAIPFYKGAGMYKIQKDNMASGIISFRKMQPLSQWVCKYPGAENDYVEIVKDEQLFVEGNFKFSGKNTLDSNAMLLSDGNFGILSHSED